jgi:hypothetical protein
MVGGLLDLVEAIVLHAPFLDRFDDTEIGLGTALQATEGLGLRIDIVQAGELQACVASADIAAQPFTNPGATDEQFQKDRFE